MSNASAAVFGYLTTKADLNFYMQQLEIYSAKYSANAEKLGVQQSYESKYEEYLDDVRTRSKKVTVGKTTIITEDLEFKSSKFGNTIAEAARNYAKTKVPKFNQELLDELTEKDIEYETIKTTMDAMVEMLKAQEEQEKANATTACQDTGILGQ